MDPAAERDLKVLEALSENLAITQRDLAARLGIALGLTNRCLRLLVQSGCIRRVNVRANRLRYVVTPKGRAEKARLTCELIKESLHTYRQARSHLRAALRRHSHDGSRIAIWGTAEAAELAYVTMRELGIEPVAVFDVKSGGRFLGIPVQDGRNHLSIGCDLIVVATFESPETAVREVVRCGIPRAKLLPLLYAAGRDGRNLLGVKRASADD